jgi:hypothetical protein
MAAKWLKSVFPDPKEAPREKPIVIEVPVASRVDAPSTEIRQALALLPFRPEFDYLMRKFRFQKAVIQSQLNSQSHKTLDDANKLQALIAALSWLETQVKFETQQQEAKKTPTTPYEVELFNQIRDSINVLE